MKHILCYGDSNTYGYDSRPCLRGLPPRRYDESVRWTCLLQKRLGDGFRVYEQGMPGRTTVFEDPLEYGRSGIAALDTVFKSNDPYDLIIVMLGTNDLQGRFAANACVITQGMERIMIRLKELIARSANPAARVLVLSPPRILPAPDGFMQYEQEWIDQGRLLPRLYQRSCQALGCLFADTSGWGDPDPADGVHLGPEGHRTFAEHLEPLVRSILAD